MKLKLIILSMVILVSACTSKDEVSKILKDNPEILTDAIKANPVKFIEALNEAVKVGQEEMQKNRAEEEKKAFEKSFENPLKAEIRDDELIRGKKGAPIQVVEYSDFECPYCSRGYQVVKEILKNYEGKVEFVFKHLPLSFHPQAMIAAQYYEAIRLQSEDKAIKFHDEIFENQSKLRQGEAFLKSIAKKLSVDMTKLAKDINSDKVKNRIKEDEAEAAKFGFQGTPGFLVNGVPVKGAYPFDHFKMIISTLEEKGKIKL